MPCRSWNDLLLFTSTSTPSIVMTTSFSTNTNSLRVTTGWVPGELILRVGEGPAVVVPPAKSPYRFGIMRMNPAPTTTGVQTTGVQIRHDGQHHSHSLPRPDEPSRVALVRVQQNPWPADDSLETILVFTNNDQQAQDVLGQLNDVIMPPSEGHLTAARLSTPITAPSPAAAQADPTHPASSVAEPPVEPSNPWRGLAVGLTLIFMVVAGLMAGFMIGQDVSKSHTGYPENARADETRAAADTRAPTPPYDSNTNNPSTSNTSTSNTPAPDAFANSLDLTPSNPAPNLIVTPSTSIHTDIQDMPADQQTTNDVVASDHATSVSAPTINDLPSPSFGDNTHGDTGTQSPGDAFIEAARGDRASGPRAR